MVVLDGKSVYLPILATKDSRMVTFKFSSCVGWKVCIFIDTGSITERDGNHYSGNHVGDYSSAFHITITRQYEKHVDNILLSVNAKFIYSVGVCLA